MNQPACYVLIDNPSFWRKKISPPFNHECFLHLYFCSPIISHKDVLKSFSYLPEVKDRIFYYIKCINNLLVAIYSETSVRQPILWKKGHAGKLFDRREIFFLKKWLWKRFIACAVHRNRVLDLSFKISVPQCSILIFFSYIWIIQFIFSFLGCSVFFF